MALLDTVLVERREQVKQAAIADKSSLRVNVGSGVGEGPSANCVSTAARRAPQRRRPTQSTRWC